MALLGVAAIGGRAQAAKTIWGWFLVATPASTPVGVTFTANGQSVMAAAYAYDNVGVVACGVRPTANNQTRTLGCPVSAVTFQASVRNISSTWCTTARIAWNGAVVGCQTPAINFVASSGAPGPYSLAAFARGYGN